MRPSKRGVVYFDETSMFFNSSDWIEGGPEMSGGYSAVLPISALPDEIAATILSCFESSHAVSDFDSPARPKVNLFELTGRRNARALNLLKAVGLYQVGSEIRFLPTSRAEGGHDHLPDQVTYAPMDDSNPIYEALHHAMKLCS